MIDCSPQAFRTEEVNTIEVWYVYSPVSNEEKEARSSCIMSFWRCGSRHLSSLCPWLTLSFLMFITQYYSYLGKWRDHELIREFCGSVALLPSQHLAGLRHNIISHYWAVQIHSGRLLFWPLYYVENSTPYSTSFVWYYFTSQEGTRHNLDLSAFSEKSYFRLPFISLTLLLWIWKSSIFYFFFGFTSVLHTWEPADLFLSTMLVHLTVISNFHTNYRVTTVKSYLWLGGGQSEPYSWTCIPKKHKSTPSISSKAKSALVRYGKDSAISPLSTNLYNS